MILLSQSHFSYFLIIYGIYLSLHTPLRLARKNSTTVPLQYYLFILAHSPRRKRIFLFKKNQLKFKNFSFAFENSKKCLMKRNDFASFILLLQKVVTNYIKNLLPLRLTKINIIKIFIKHTFFSFSLFYLGDFARHARSQNKNKQ